jgi:hypothetical protein
MIISGERDGYGKLEGLPVGSDAAGSGLDSLGWGFHFDDVVDVEVGNVFEEVAKHFNCGERI